MQICEDVCRTDISIDMNEEAMGCACQGLLDQCACFFCFFFKLAFKVAAFPDVLMPCSLAKVMVCGFVDVLVNRLQISCCLF